MTIEITYEAAGWQGAGFDALAETAIGETLAHLALQPSDWLVSILACDDARIAELNTEFRGKSTPTNVLSWPAQDLAAPHEGDTPATPEPDIFGDDTELGDIAIALETCTREALEAGKPLADHVLHLVIHGVLHLLGYDHIRDKDATLMEGIEVAILGKLGLPDPYREEHGD
ncbi:rRNA maturation RNase YbeY [uncultured Shimia sp.]|uniref:rRNA maturation RNase YbeY n=1 Tax=uncultured Shimia sp. TaxID=573152 RepID=UPI002616FB95|nr:rRNA maturation RNase YbeY [uncultured Shimia sp.]